MKIAYFDTIAGISGDMALGAFVSAGFRFDDLVKEIKKLGLTGYELEARHIERSGITATKVDVLISEQPKYHRHLRDILAMIDGSGLSVRVKTRASAIFHEIGVAEATVHGTTLEKIHFHEVGAIDSLVDIVGVAICLEYFGIEKVYSSAVKIGNGGFVDAQHGTIPVPTPATTEILKGYPTILTDISSELTTPTGAAIIKALSSGLLSHELLTIEAVGYGAGTRNLDKLPNLLRVMIGRLEATEDADGILSLETNIDDMNPEIYPFVLEQLFSAGVNDAYLVPIIMKKGRPGVVLSALVERSKLDAALDIVFRETSTLGVRIHPVERRKLLRSIKEVQTSLGLVRVKAVLHEQKEVLLPEYEECRRIALEQHLPLIDVYRILDKELRT
jgi:hypothetical protein